MATSFQIFRYTKLGFAGNKEPQFIIPSAIAIKESARVGDQNSRRVTKGVEDLDFYIGDEAFDATGYSVKVSLDSNFLKIYKTWIITQPNSFLFPYLIKINNIVIWNYWLTSNFLFFFLDKLSWSKIMELFWVFFIYIKSYIFFKDLYIIKYLNFWRIFKQTF